MKKVLFTTTALVAVAGMAVAEVSVGGSARISLVYDASKDSVASGSNFRVEKRMTINFSGSQETDGGLTLGGHMRLRSDEKVQHSPAGARVWIGTDMWTVTVGNASGAIATRVGFYQGTVGLTGLHYANVGFSMGTTDSSVLESSSTGAGADVVRLDFNVGDFGVSLSTSSTGDHLNNGQTSSVAVGYNFGDWSVAAGFQNNKATVVGSASVDTFALSAAGSIGDFGVGFQFVDTENIASKIVLSGSYDFGDTTVTAFVANTNEDTLGSAGIDTALSETEYGIGFTYSLGGATLAGGISRNYTEETMADIGIRWGF